MKKTCCLFLGLIFLFSCGSDPETKELTYQNIMILSDMSSRLVNKPNKDKEEIDKILSYFVQNIFLSAIFFIPYCVLLL